MTPAGQAWTAHRNALKPLLAALGASGEALPELRPTGSDPVAAATERCGVRAHRAPVAQALTWLPKAPVLASRDGEPVALLPSGRGWTAVEATGRHGRPVSPADAGGFDEHCWVMRARLPHSGITGRRLLRFSLRGAAMPLTGTLAGGLLAAVLAFAAPIGSLLLITAVLTDDDALFGWTCAALLAAVPLGRLLAELRDHSTSALQTRIEGTVEPAVWERVLSLPLPFLRRYSSVRLLNHAGGIGRLRSLLGPSGLDALLSALFSAVAITLLMLVDGMLGLVAAAVTAGLLTLLGWLSWAQQKHDMRVYDAVESVQSTVYPALLGIDEVRAYGAQRLVFRKWWQGFDAQKRADDAGLRHAEVSAALIAATLPLLLCVLLPVVQLRGVGSTGIWAVSFAAVQLNLALSRLPGVLQAVFTLRTTYARLEPILATAPETPPAGVLPGRLTGRAELRGVTFGYPGSAEPVLKGVDLTVEPGEFLAVVGESGAGKSTLLRLLLGLDRPDAGAVLLDGHDLAGLDLGAVRGQMGYVPQDSKVLRGTIRSVILGSAPEHEEEAAWHAAGLAGIADEIRAMPMGMDTRLTDGESGFSGGQLQRLLIARALVGRPRVLLLDEATSALDNATQDEISTAIGALGITRIVVAHRLSTIRRADRIVVVSDGRITESGSADLPSASGGPLPDPDATTLT
ncbi:ATP-binding cassette domain-containing protein [Streptomyces sp. NPDC059564]|uniref:ATP-binding cassette domain-containing protein n=1 Tax=Streptomyces sp. NPDC059564 TaxID=3346865 RepID=UPI0036B6FEC2